MEIEYFGGRNQGNINIRIICACLICKQNRFIFADRWPMIRACEIYNSNR